MQFSPLLPEFWGKNNSRCQIDCANIPASKHILQAQIKSFVTGWHFAGMEIEYSPIRGIPTSYFYCFFTAQNQFGPWLANADRGNGFNIAHFQFLTSNVDMNSPAKREKRSRNSVSW